MQTKQIKKLVIFSAIVALISGCSQNSNHLPLVDIHNDNSSSQSHPGSGPYFQSDILPLVKNNCMPCHAAGTGHDWTSYSVFKSEKAQILVRVLGPNANMPLSGKLSEADRSLLQAWINAGMPYAAATPTPEPNPGPDPNPTPTPTPNPVPAPTVAQLQACVGCHGDNGNSKNSMFPVLAGQTQTYISNQLTAFLNKTRAESDAQIFMWPVAQILTPDEIAIYAAFFANQSPAATHEGGDPAKITAGKNIFENGIPEKGVPACVSCHGGKGEGLANFPRLAGQYKEYIGKQLNFFKSGLRNNDPTMPALVKQLSTEDIEDLSEYVNSL